MAIFASRNYGWAEQDVASLLDYCEDWADFLSAGDTIATSVWAADSSDLVLTNPAIAGAITTVWASGGVAGREYQVSNTITTALGRRDIRYFVLSIVNGAAAPVLPIKTSLFSRFTAVNEFKKESLSFLDRSFPIDGITDDVIWESMVSAESQAQHDLRVFLEPTVVIPEDAEQSEVDALVAAGTKFVQEPSYDYEPAGWTADAWGFMVTRQMPIIQVDSVKFSYPNADSDFLMIPAGWIRLDKKYGQIRFVPNGSTANLGPLSYFILSQISSGRTIPNMIQVRYVAGVANVKQKYPELVTLVKRMAILKVLKDAFLPQSSSISADGLSQSNSIDLSKWQDSLDGDMEKLRENIHGIRMMVV